MEDSSLTAHGCRRVVDVATHECVGDASGIRLIFERERSGGVVNPPWPYPHASRAVGEQPDDACGVATRLICVTRAHDHIAERARGDAVEQRHGDTAV